MGHKDKKQNRNRSSERKPKKQKKERTVSSDDSVDMDSRSRSPVERKHKKKHRHDSSDSSISNQPIERKRDKKKKEDFLKDKKDKKLQKELVKSLETPEEKRARRLAKKEAKERRRKEKMGWDKDYMGYTNTDNPFGDEHLLDAFVWGKKMGKDGEITRTDMQKMANSKMGENRRELEKVKLRRLEREKELEERENDRESLQRDKEAEYYREWEKQEDNFHLNQAKLRSKIRIQDGRAKPIDLLAKFISAEDDELAIEMHEPYTYLHGLTIVDIEDLLEDIKVYLELEQGKNTDYWRDIVTVTEDELDKLRKMDISSREYYGERREGINQAVVSDVSDVFKAKTTNQLLLLEDQIREKLKGGEGIDIGYWESLLQQLKAHMARTRLRERHQDVLRQKLHKLKAEQGIASTPLFPVMQTSSEWTENQSEWTRSPIAGASETSFKSPAQPVDSPLSGPSPATSFKSPAQLVDSPLAGPSTATSFKSPAQPVGSPLAGPSPATSYKSPAQSVDSPLLGPSPATSSKSSSLIQEENNEESDVLLTEEDLEQEAMEEYVAGSYSPRLFRTTELDLDAIVYETVDDLKKLELARTQVLTIGKVKLDGETEFEKKAREGMNDDEAQFSVEVSLDKQAFLWSDKYRPRKPRFFNRVHTGFEWNKYNQTHYDIDNPPPKIVQGYKFNIFYPDLIDKADTPEYTVTPSEDNKEFAVLKFHSGPPYEDIAFKIVNREWEYSYKRGFRCQFQNNIFQLWFHFKRYRYRR